VQHAYPGGSTHLYGRNIQDANNVAKTLGHIAEALHYTKQQCLNSESIKVLPELIKDCKANLSVEMESKINVLKKKLTPPPSVQEKIESATKEIGQAAKQQKASSPPSVTWATQLCKSLTPTRN
jgi:hypothetical protein